MQTLVKDFVAQPIKLLSNSLTDYTIGVLKLLNVITATFKTIFTLQSSLALMESLAYLYILAEEANQLDQNQPQLVPLLGNEQPVLSHWASGIAIQPAETSKACLNYDRDSQSYPTFYL
jgi:hypothetical protein